MAERGVRTPYYQIFIGTKELSKKFYNKIQKVVFKEPEEGEQYFTIYFNDQDYSLQESNTFVVEKTAVSLYMGYMDDYDEICDGIVSALSPNYPKTGVPTLEVTVKNISQVMNRAQKNKKYIDKTYSDIAIDIAKEYGLKHDVDSTIKIFDPKANKKKNKKAESIAVYQTGKSDYEFMRAIAKKIGYKFYIDRNKLYFKKSVVKKEVTLEYRLGKCNLLEFKPNVNSTNTGNKYKSSEVDFSGGKMSKKGKQTGATEKESKEGTVKKYTVKSGDYLIKIAKEVYKDGSRYKDIYNANTDKIKMPGYVVYTGTTLVIP